MLDEISDGFCYQHHMTVDALDSAHLPPAEDAEEVLVTMARLGRFDASRRGIPASDLRQWMLKRRIDPAAPCPKARPID